MICLEVDVIYNQDCIQGMRTLPEKSVDLVVTDPPYMIYTRGAGMYNQPDKQYVNELRGMDNGFSPDVLELLCAVMKKINIYLFCSQKQIIPLLDFFVKGKGCNWNILSWHKTNPIPACGNKYITDTEFILFFREKGVKVFGSVDTKKTYYLTPLNQSDKKKYGHPTVKPVSIVQNLILNSSAEGAVVLDPFLGSGTTAVAAVNTNRHYIGYETDAGYFDIACDRLDAAERENNSYLL